MEPILKMTAKDFTEKLMPLSDAELENIAKDESIETPSDLHAKAQEAILAAVLSPQKRTPKAVTSILAAAALAAAALLLLIGRPQKQPKTKKKRAPQCGSPFHFYV